MKFQELFSLSEEQKEETHRLWNQEYPKNLNYATMEDFEAYLQGLENLRHLLLLDDSGTIKGWYFDFDRENARWFGMMLDQSVQRQGHGSAILREVQVPGAELNGWVIDKADYLKANGEFYKSPLQFYQKNGFETLVDIRLEIPIFSAVKIRWSAEVAR